MTEVGDTLVALEPEQPARPKLLLEPGSQIGRYLVLERLGAGGMGVVFAAWDADLDRKVALKLLSPRHANSEQARAQLIHEAQATARVHHTNVVVVHDVGETQGAVFVAMEYIAGGTLRSHLSEQRLGWREIVALFVEAGQGLAAAHAAGLVHRDFKPENVMLDEHGRVVVLDFGLAIRSESSLDGLDGLDGLARGGGELDGGTRDSAELESTRAHQTRHARLVGTPLYMSLEQLHGELDIDARSDQYSFCVALWEALTGEPPFTGEGLLDIAAAKLEGQLQPFTRQDVPEQVRAALERGLAPHAADRWPDMASLLAALRPPAPRIARWQLITAALLILGSIAIVSQLLATQQVEDPCRDARSRAREALTRDQRVLVERAFTAVEQPWAAQARVEVVAGLERWALSWGQEQVSACEAHFIERRESAELFDHRAACLDDAHARFRNLVEMLGESKARALAGAAVAVAELPAPVTCRDGEALRAWVLEPDDAELREQVRSLRAALDRAQQREALITSTTLERDPRTLSELVERAQALGYAPLEAEALLARMRLRMRIGDSAGASMDAEAALVAARLGNVAHDEARAAIGLSYAASQRQDLDEARRWQKLAAAAAAAGSAGSSSKQLAREQLELRARIAYDGGEWERALRYDEQLAEQLAERYGPRSVAYANALVELGQLLVEYGELERGLTELREGHTLLRERLGAAHPDSAIALERIGYALLLDGRPSEALEQLTAAERHWSHSGHEHDAAHLLMLRHQAVALSELGRCEDARALLEEVHAWVYEQYGRASTEYAMVNLYQGWVCGWSAQDAYALIDESMRALELMGEAHRVGALAARAERGFTAYVHGNTAAARADFEDIRAALRRNPMSEQSRRVWGMEAALDAGFALVAMRESPEDPQVRAQLELLAARGDEFRYRTRPILALIDEALGPTAE